MLKDNLQNTDKGFIPKLACIIIVYFGRFPAWMPAYLESCKWNKNFDFLIFSDANFAYANIPKNVTIAPLTLEQFNNIYLRSFPNNKPIKFHYKLCDLKPIYGILFHEYIKNYPFFWWGDLDVIYGNIEKYLTDEMLKQEVISFHWRHISGHLCLVQTKLAKILYLAFPDWSEKVNFDRHVGLDEPAHLEGVSYYAQESFNTPWSEIISWTNGEFVFPSEWYWENGVLTNDLDGTRDFPYLHFMQWRRGNTGQRNKDRFRKLFHLQWYNKANVFHMEPEDVKWGFKINKKGFFK